MFGRSKRGISGGMIAALAIGLALGPAGAQAQKTARSSTGRTAKPAVAPEVVASPVPPVDLNALLTSEGNGTVFHKDGVDERVANACRLQPRIDAWAEGSVISLEGGTLVIYGHKLPYATLYARMMKDINARTKGLTGPALEKRVQEIQDEWQKRKLARTDVVTPENDAEIKFALARGGRIAFLDDGGAVMARVGGPLHLPTTIHGAPVTFDTNSADLKALEDADEPPNDAIAAQARQAADLVASSGSKDDDTETLHVGDKIRVGYDSKQKPPMAFVSYRTARPSSVVALDQEGMD